MRIRCLLLLAAVLTSPAWGAFPVAEPTAFLISNSLFDRSPSLATDGQGNSVVVWSRVALPRVTVVARRFDPQGNPLGKLLQVAANGSLPTVAMNSRGDFVVAWLDASSPKPFGGYPIRVQRFAANGARVGGTTQLNTPVETPLTPPVLGIDSNGGFAATWSSRSGVFVRRFDAKGAPLEASHVVAPGFGSSLAMQADGGFTLVWLGLELTGRRYGADGKPQGADFQINQSKVDGTQSLNVAATQDGGFVAAWDFCDTATPHQGLTPCRVLARRFDAGSQPVTDELAVSPQDGHVNDKPVVAAGNGYFAIAWRNCQSATSCTISTQLFSPQSTPSPRIAAATIGSDLTPPAVTASPTGFVVAFSSASCSHFFPGCRNNNFRGLYLWRFDFR